MFNHLGFRNERQEYEGLTNKCREDKMHSVAHTPHSTTLDDTA